MPNHPFLAPSQRAPKPARPHNMDHADPPPPDPGDRAKWTELVLDNDPKAEADRRRHRAQRSGWPVCETRYGNHGACGSVNGLADERCL